MYACMYVCMYVRVCMYVCMHVPIYLVICVITYAFIYYLFTCLLFIYGPALKVAAPIVFTVWLPALEELVTCPRTASDKSRPRSGIT